MLRLLTRSRAAPIARIAAYQTLPGIYKLFNSKQNINKNLLLIYQVPALSLASAYLAKVANNCTASPRKEPEAVACLAVIGACPTLKPNPNSD